MGLFDMFGKKKKEESTEPKKEEKHIEYNVDEISTSFYIDRQKRYEEQNKERERQTEENLRKMKEAARQEVERKEKERQLAQKQRELEQAKKEYDRETSKQLDQFERETQQMKNKMQAEIDKTTQEQEHIYAYLSKELEEVNNLPGNKRAMETAVKQYNSLLKKAETEKKEKEFEKYEKISTMLMSSEEWGLGIYFKDNKEEVLKYRELSDDDRNCFFVPFLIEKKSYGLAGVDDLKNLDQMRKNSKMSIKEQYTRGLVLLQELQLIDITDADIFSKTFKEFSTMNRDEIKRQSELSGMIDDKKDDSFEKGGSNTK